MAFATNSIYVTAGGQLLNGTEHWQTGWHFSNTVDPGSAIVVDGLRQVSVQDVFNHVKTFWTTAGATGFTFPNYDSLEWVKMAAIGKDGKYLTDPITYEAHTPGVGTGNTYAIPPQLAVCVSLWSGSKLGKANHGRSYWPLPSNFERVDLTTGLLNPTAVNIFRDQFRTMLQNVAGEVSTVVYPNDPALLSSLGSGTTKYITKIGVGLAVDTMRSRRRDLADTVQNYVTPVWPD